MEYIRVENPVLDIGVALVGGLLSLRPCSLNLLNQRFGVLLGALLNFLALEGQIVVQSLSIPAIVRRNNLVVPVVLDQVLKILTVGGGGIRNVVIGQPTLKLRLVPLVVH